MSELQTWKAICEIRYAPTASFFDHRGAIADRWYKREGFEHWRISDSSVESYSTDERLRYVVSSGRAAYEVETPKEIAAFCDLAPQLLTHTQDTLGIHKLERIGLRLIQLSPRANFRATMRDMRHKLFTLGDQEWALLGGPAVDVAFVVDLDLDDRKAHFQVGPIEEIELKRWFKSKVAIDSAPHPAVVVDFDVYSTPPKWTRKEFSRSLDRFVSDSFNEIEKRSRDFLEQYRGFGR